jgi:excisionase family DNA binding protein
MTLGDDKLLLRVSEAQRILSLSRSTLYAMIASGKLPCVRIGRAVRVPIDGLKDWVKRHTENDESVVNDSIPPAK